MAEGSRGLGEPAYFVLAALLDGPMHGHAIIKAVRVLSESRVKLAVGTLYGALDRLAANHLITVDREETVDGRRRRCFRLTEEGGSQLRAEARRLHQAASVVIGTAFA
ncbi:PadR family transcriptional regulator [Nonomuraea sp. SBT364]|uniref:PadR family transcriptional regulator n=1 Tax=Nonomuraea sp. SBT364 TaxID=1580530 RepID=UPI00066A1CEC|nr:PadR family transcriptional regulator [Nonomuraea sp. SBT364]